MKLLYIPLMFLLLFFSSFLLFSKTPEIESSKLKEIEIFLAEKTPFEQIIFLDKLISQNQSSIELYKMKARIELTTSDYIGVIKTVLTVLKLNKEDIELLRLLAVSYFNLNDLQKSSFYFNKLLDYSPQDGVAIFYLSLIEPVDRSGLSSSFKSKSATDIHKLVAIFNELDNSADIPFTYLLDRIVLNLDEQDGYSYTMHHIIHINKAEAISRFKSFKYSYDSNSFTPALLTAGTYEKGNIEEFRVLDNLDENFKIGGIYPEGYVSFDFSNLSAGSIIEYKIKFSLKPDKMKQWAEHFYFTTLNKTIKKELQIIKPANMKLFIKRLGNESSFTEEVKGNSMIMSYRMLTPPLLNEGDRRTASARPSEEVIISTYEDLPELQESFSKLFSRIVTENNGDEQNELPVDERIKSVYHEHQSYLAVPDDSDFEFNNIEGRLRYHFDKTIKSTARFIDSLNEAGVEAYPVLVRDEELATLYTEPVHPYIFNHGLIYIAAQPGVESGFFLDISSPYIDYRNLSPLLQGREVFILKGDDTIESAHAPVISSEENIIEESYRMELNTIGKADLEINKSFKGAFATLLRSETSDLTGDELIKHFLMIDSALNKDFERDSVKFRGYDSPSGPIYVDLESVENNFIEIFFDGRQVLKENIKTVSPLFRFPHKSSIPYTVPFLFTYKKTSEYIFPDGYVISEHNLRSFSRENRYLYFNFEPQKIAENHFIFNFEFSIKKREIAPTDLFDLNMFVNSLIEHFNIELTMKSTDFDYNSFFELLIAEYSEPYLYQGYIERLLEDKKLDKAEETALRGLSAFSDNSYFKTILALIYLEKEEFQKSEQTVMELMDSDSDNPKLYHYLITLYKRSGNKTRLAETIAEAYRKFPADDDIVTEVVNFYQNQQEYEKAIVILKERLDASPEESKGRYYSELGYIYSLQKNFTDAELQFLKAIELNKDDAYSLNNLAWLYCENAVKIEKAIEYAERACTLDESKDSFLDTLAEAYYIKGDYEKSLKAIKRALELNSESDYLKKQLDKIEKAYDKEQNEDSNGK